MSTERVARKHHTTPKHSCSHVKEDDNSSVNISEQFFVQLAFILMMIGNVIQSVLSLNSLKLKWVIGLSTLACVSREDFVPADPLLPSPLYVFGWGKVCVLISYLTQTFMLHGCIILINISKILILNTRLGVSLS